MSYNTLDDPFYSQLADLDLITYLTSVRKLRIRVGGSPESRPRSASTRKTIICFVSFCRFSRVPVLRSTISFSPSSIARVLRSTPSPSFFSPIPNAVSPVSPSHLVFLLSLTDVSTFVTPSTPLDALTKVPFAPPVFRSPSSPPFPTGISSSSAPRRSWRRFPSTGAAPASCSPSPRFSTPP